MITPQEKNEILDRMSQNMSQQAQNMSQLTRPQKIELRNNKILCDIAIGKTKSSICEEYRISLRQLNRMLKESHEELDTWYETISKEGMFTLFRQNSRKVFAELEKLETLRSQEEDTKTQFEMTKDIITAYSSYNKMIAEGPVLTKYKELTDQMTKIIQGKRE